MHGGDVYRNQVELDFSVNVNPLGMPEGVRDALVRGIDAAGNYPDPFCEELREKLAAHFCGSAGREGAAGQESAAERENAAGQGLTAENVLCGNGASELLLSVCRWKNPGSALLLAPGFSGYQKALEACGCQPEFFALREEEGFGLPGKRFAALCEKVLEMKPGLLFIANPSNPAGTLLSGKLMTKLATCCKKAGTTLVIDECFMELTADPAGYSMVNGLLEHENVLILRAFTKSFAIPGIRLGYLLCPKKETAREIARQLPEWNVSVPAQLSGLAALREEEWLRRARRLIAQERCFLAGNLAGMGIRTYESAANFLLFRCGEEKLFEKLLGKGILIRDCRDYPGLGRGYYRIAVKTRKENETLLRNVQEALRKA